MKKDTLALIDDDTIHSNLYVAALKLGGFEVSYFETARSFFDAIEGEEGLKYSAIICDLMMPWGNAFSPNETDNGLSTGFSIASEIRNRCIQSPIIIFTNMNVESRLAHLERQTQNLYNVFVLRKSDASPAQLVRVMQSLLEKGSLSEKQIGVIRQFFDSLVLKPSIFGMGIDLKELFKIKWRE